MSCIDSRILDFHLGFIFNCIRMGLQTKLVGQMLYYVLTTGSGQQTLGEEYCDVTQVFHSP